MTPHDSSTPIDPLIGKVFSARILSKHLDSCDFLLDGGQRVRLYQRDSCAIYDERLMIDIPRYAVHQLCDLLITHHRMDERGSLYYANERWAVCNPWNDLALKVRDSVQGEVIDYIYGEHDVLKGYHIQLDTDRNINQHPNAPFQPDILVYLSVDELPWDDGEITQARVTANARRILLEKGDQVRVMLTQIHRLPLYPASSLLQQIYHNDQYFEHEVHLAERSARVKERLHKPHLSLTEYNVLPESGFRLDGYHIVLIDDRKDSIERLTHTLKKNGATVTPIHLSSTLSDGDVVEKIHLLWKQQKVDLVLIDNALPQANDGLYLVRNLLQKYPEHASQACALISSFFEEHDIHHIKTSLPSLRGALLRPITIPQIIELCRGGHLFFEGIPPSHQDMQPANIQDYCRQLIKENIVDSIIVLNLEHGRAQLDFSMGIVPFSISEIERLAKESQLRLLLSEKINTLEISHDNNTDAQLLGLVLKEVFWHRFTTHDGTRVKVVGLGWKDKNHRIQARLLADNLHSRYENDAMHHWILHHSSFISSGIVVHSLLHEGRQYINQLDAAISNLKLASEKGVLNQETTKIITDLVDKTLKDLSDLTNVLLKGQAQRAEPTDIQELVAFVKTMIEPFAKESHVHFITTNTPHMTLGIAASNISIPLINLMLNAFKHNSRKKQRKASLSIQTKHNEHGYWLEFSVGDNGGGIPHQRTLQLFRPGISFAPNSQERHGIGLWLARTLAKRVGGDVFLSENLRGLGVRFTLRLPLILG